MRDISSGVPRCTLIKSSTPVHIIHVQHFTQPRIKVVRSATQETKRTQLGLSAMTSPRTESNGTARVDQLTQQLMRATQRQAENKGHWLQTLKQEC